MEPAPNGSLGRWLKERCQKDSLSIRQAAKKAGLSHGTIADIIQGKQATPHTIAKLATAFGGGDHQRQVLQDELLLRAGYRRPTPGGVSQPLAQLVDRMSEFSEAQLKIVAQFADFLAELKEEK